MTEMPPVQQPEFSAGQAQPPGENAFWATLRQPRILLILLGAWAILGAVTEFFTSSPLFLDLHNQELDGALGGRALGWEAIPLAVLYLYASRDPGAYRGVFWIALIEQGAAILANVFRLSAGDFSLESVIIPIAGAAFLGLLVVLHLFQPREPKPSPAQT